MEVVPVSTTPTVQDNAAAADSQSDYEQDCETVQRYQEAERRQHHPSNPPMSKHNHQGNSLSKFLTKHYPPAEPLIKGLLNRRECAALIGRRRHGKTALLWNVVLSLAIPKPDLFCYPILQAQRSVAFFLEDDGGEMQEKVRAMLGSQPIPDGIAVYTKDDFLGRGIPIDIGDKEFQAFVWEACQQAKPDVIIFDNLAHLVRADYNDAKQIDRLMQFVYRLQSCFNAAVIIAAHPRKRGNDDDDKTSLELDPERFFESCMGSSHFINSTGTLWGIERIRGKEKTVFVGGTQRRDGSQGLTPLEYQDGWFAVTDDSRERLTAALNTDKRKMAWDALPSQPFTRAEAEKAASPYLRHAAFLAWWQELEHVKAVTAQPDGRYERLRLSSMDVLVV
jgi:hypothetical protein